MAKTCMLCDEPVTKTNQIRFCSDCGEEGCQRCVIGGNGEGGLCVDCADEPESFESDAIVPSNEDTDFSDAVVPVPDDEEDTEEDDEILGGNDEESGEDDE